jgi:hypothetical protein
MVVVVLQVFLDWKQNPNWFADDAILGLGLFPCPLAFLKLTWIECNSGG